MVGFFDDIWNDLKNTIKDELQDLSYMEIVTATTNKVEGHLDNTGWDVLDSLRRGNPPSFYGSTRESEKEILPDDMLNNKNVVLLARTRIEVDGDVLTLLKGENGKPLAMSEQAKEFHEIGTKISMENWATFVKFVLELSQTVAYIVADPSLRKLPSK